MSAKVFKLESGYSCVFISKRSIPALIKRDCLLRLYNVEFCEGFVPFFINRNGVVYVYKK